MTKDFLTETPTMNNWWNETRYKHVWTCNSMSGHHHNWVPVQCYLSEMNLVSVLFWSDLVSFFPICSVYTKADNLSCIILLNIWSSYICDMLCTLKLFPKLRNYLSKKALSWNFGSNTSLLPNSAPQYLQPVYFLFTIVNLWYHIDIISRIMSWISCSTEWGYCCGKVKLCSIKLDTCILYFIQ